MDRIMCKPKEGSNIFLVGCILFSVNCLYALWSMFNYVDVFSIVKLVLSAAICVLFFLVYTERIKLFIPFIVLAVNSFFDFANGTLANSGILGFLAIAAAIYATLCVIGVINFRANLNLGNSLGSVNANEACLIGALAFMVIGIITAVRCAFYLIYGLPAIYILSILCYFGGAVLVLLGSEPEGEYVADKTSRGYSYEEAASMAGGNTNMNNGENTMAGENANMNIANMNIANMNNEGNNSDSQTTAVAKPTCTAEGSLEYLLKSENIVANVLLSVVTLGIFYIIWLYRICKKIRIIEKRDTSCGVELICILLVPFYVLYWYYTRAKRMSEFAEANYNIHIDSNEVVYLVLSLCGLGIVATILIQSDLNGFVEKYNANLSGKALNYNRGENSESFSHKNNAEEVIDTIKKLSELKDEGILSEEEFSAKKAELLQKM